MREGGKEVPLSRFVAFLQKFSEVDLEAIRHPFTMSPRFCRAKSSMVPTLL